MKSVFAISLVGIALVGCTHTSGLKVSGKANDIQAGMLTKVKSLEGDWTTPPGPDGKPGVISFHTSSAGSVVREIMFPGTDHEMTNMYHMDGPACVVTHYCAMNNQPLMAATQMDGNSLAFKTRSVSNHASNDEGYMGGLTLTFVDADHVEEHWTSYKSGKVTERADFVLTRKH